VDKLWFFGSVSPPSPPMYSCSTFRERKEAACILVCSVHALCSVFESSNRGTQRETFGKILEFYLWFLRLFPSFVKACLCELTQVDLFGVFSQKFKAQKILGLASQTLCTYDSARCHSGFGPPADLDPPVQIR